MDVLFIDKKATVKEGQEQPKIILRLDATKKNQERCTVMQVINPTPKFNEAAPWCDGSITSLGEIKDWHTAHREDFDAYIYDGEETALDNKKPSEDEERVTKIAENNEL